MFVTFHFPQPFPTLWSLFCFCIPVSHFSSGFSSFRNVFSHTIKQPWKFASKQGLANVGRGFGAIYGFPRRFLTPEFFFFLFLDFKKRHLKYPQLSLGPALGPPPPSPTATIPPNNFQTFLRVIHFFQLPVVRIGPLENGSFFSSSGPSYFSPPPSLIRSFSNLPPIDGRLSSVHVTLSFGE